MGASSSSANTAPPPPSPTLRKPWRTMSWGDRLGDLQYVKEYQPCSDAVKHLRILLYGPVGVGKSSFVNSVRMVFSGKMSTPALASANNGDKSFTKKYQTHKIPKEEAGSFYSLVFNEMMGLEEESGVCVDDVKLALRGHVKDGHKFNPESPLSSSDPGYNPSPSADDRVHVLVWVCSANTPKIANSVVEKMKAVREAASDMDIPQMALVTKVDEACGETQTDLKNIYRSKHVKQKMTEFSSVLGIPMNCIMPVKNYSHEIHTDHDVDSVILSALRLMVDLGDDFISNM